MKSYFLMQLPVQYNLVAFWSDYDLPVQYLLYLYRRHFEKTATILHE